MRHTLRLLSVGAILAGVAFPAEKSPLAQAPSDFVRAQAASAVHWQPWSEATLTQAKAAGKSVYVFIGSPLSELTRATIAQTFGSEKTVAWLNENFTCLFVDADAQPDVAALGQHFIVSVKQLRGQPVHLWLTPDTLQPYDGANYLPPSEEWGKPGFLKAARAALDTWKLEPDRARALAAEASEMMKLPAVDPSTKLDIAAKLDAAAKAWVASADPVHGGFGSAPKLPEPELIRFLLARGDAASREAAIKAAKAIVSGALRDPVDGGFYRRCIDEAWKEPYFQKTLVDQARIALALFDAADVTGDDSLRQAAEGALKFSISALRNPDGSFTAALDGTQEESPTGRPRFVPVSRASLQAVALLYAAIWRSHVNYIAVTVDIESKLREFNPGGGFLPHTLGLAAPGTPADYLAVAWLRRVGKNAAQADGVAAYATGEFFDIPTGAYMATTVQLPSGIATRVPASGDTPSAEVLALLAGVDAKTADLIRRNLMNQIEYDELPPGDVLLGLSQGQK